ncbi:MAG: DUF2961 domain-containing protein [Bacteroidales bacterium]|nr:DUF2961 domain-containing protein [Bacteroidales bacterium]
MTDRDGLARFKDYKCLQASSYDRHSVAKDKDGWFANLDRNWWLRIERERGRREFVMMDSEGPGAVTCFWMTAYEDVLRGIVRIYLDGAAEPLIEAPMADLLGSDRAAPQPLAAAVPEANPPKRRGYNLYMPIPYSKSCKITFEGATIDENNPGADNTKVGKVYYNIEYRTYPEGTNVRTLTRKDLSECRGAMAAAGKMLAEGPGTDGLGVLPLDCTLAPGRSRSFRLRGPMAIRQLGLNIVANDQAKALRNVIIEISFDGITTVRVPAGDFFGTGTVRKTFSTWMSSCGPDGLNAFWIMPFRKKCILTLSNLSDESVAIAGASLRYGPWDWDENSMHFCASWEEGSYEVGSRDCCYDLSFVRLKGRGNYVGTSVSIVNGARKWWGEGDEKIYVDGESFPSHFGTGSEDFFGYAWSSPTPFGHPFIAQPCGEGANRPGFVSNLRWRSLDAIPFRESLDFDMEFLQTSVPGTVTYGRVNYWYMVPSF